MGKYGSVTHGLIDSYEMTRSCHSAFYGDHQLYIISYHGEVEFRRKNGPNLLLPALENEVIQYELIILKL